ncbi:hypothetical protein JI739_22270 [Ramlibacter sp. AW1]|uniref:Uncharacterized protein n=1 Tax=Ramlibacter aurantiacus TaxID=2801330 RepID=A0A937D5U7_9BURK|nr:hypothetical protein [Ramlibacter aurantiacus]MBL0423080.1 hypothetical protein [Ramlibacter aurantiacus]
MTRFPLKNLVACTIALGALAVGSAAHARGEFAGGADPHRAARSTTVVIQHRPVLKPHALPVHPQHGWAAPRPQRDARDRYDHHRYSRGDSRFDPRFYGARHVPRHGAWGDFDRDGVPNRYDRAPRNPRRH